MQSGECFMVLFFHRTFITITSKSKQKILTSDSLGKSAVYNQKRVIMVCVRYTNSGFILQKDDFDTRIENTFYCRAVCITRNFSDSQNPQFIIKSGFSSRAGYYGVCYTHSVSPKYNGEGTT